MENSFQTSFIPKKPIIDNGANSNNKNTTSISIVISVFIFIVMIVSTAGLYFYRGYLEKNKQDMSESLSKMRDSFDDKTIAELELYDKKVSTAKQVLSGHTVLSPLFYLLNDLTLSSVQYTKFNHSTENGVFSVEMSGIAKDYRSIALQADVFNTNKGSMLKDVIFSNLTKDQKNNVTFNMEFTVDPTLLSYANNITLSNDSPSTDEINTQDINQVVVPQTDVNNNPLQTTNNTQ